MRRTYVLPVLAALVSEKGLAAKACDQFSPRVERLLGLLRETEVEFVSEVLQAAIKEHESGARHLGRWWLKPTVARMVLDSWGWSTPSRSRRTR